VLALVGKGRWPLLIVTTRQNPDPVRTVARYFSHLSGVPAASEQPNDLEVAAFDRISRLAILLLQFIRGEMGSNLHIFWHGNSSGQTTLPEEMLLVLQTLGSSAVSLISDLADLVSGNEKGPALRDLTGTISREDAMFYYPFDCVTVEIICLSCDQSRPEQ
jgi:hypothetical protein